MMRSHAMRIATLHQLVLLIAILFLFVAPAAAAPITFTVTASEPVTVTGTPRIAINVGGVTRYANFVSTSGSAMTFSYQVQAGDFDPDGISFDTPQIDLNGATITDLAGNPLSGLSFTAPNTSGLRVQTYTVAFASTANPANLSFTINKAPVNASFTWTISTSGGSGTVSGPGTVTGLTHTVSGVDASALAAGTLTLSVTASTGGVNGEARTATTTPALTGALDALPTPAAAFSVRRLRAAYAGPLLRVRRSADNGEQDIGATLAGNLDAAALAGFCGAGTCFVRTWYDQSPNGGHMNQAGALNQPSIVTGGILETEGSRAALRFLVGWQFLDGAVMASQTLTASVNAVARCTDTTLNRHVLGDRAIGPAEGRILRALAGGGSYVGANIGGATVTLAGATTQQRIITLLSSNAGMSGALDGILTSGSTSTFYQTSTYPYRIGGGGPGQGGGDWIGTISEVMFFDFTMSGTDRQTLERSQGSYFGITVP